MNNSPWFWILLVMGFLTLLLAAVREYLTERERAQARESELIWRAELDLAKVRSVAYYYQAPDPGAEYTINGDGELVEVKEK